jgi:hypothetical protein
VSDTIEVVDRDRRLAFSFDELLKYHGGGSPGGVAHALKVLERAPSPKGDSTSTRRLHVPSAAGRWSASSFGSHAGSAA